MIMCTANGIKRLVPPSHLMAYGPHRGKLRFVRWDGTPIFVIETNNEIRIANHLPHGLDVVLSRSNIGRSMVELRIDPKGLAFSVNTFITQQQVFGPFADTDETRIGLGALPDMFTRIIGLDKLIMKP